MLSSEEKKFALCATNFFYSNSRVVRTKISERKKKTHNPPLCKLNGRSLTKAIKKLNPNKSCDEFGLVAEHLNYGVEVSCPPLTNVFNEILASRKSPESLKSGILTPVRFI